MHLTYSFQSSIFLSYRLAVLCLVFIFYSCASHPIVNPHLPQPGKVKKGYALSVENIAPFLWYRVGVSDKSEIGFTLGKITEKFELYDEAASYFKKSNIINKVSYFSNIYNRHESLGNSIINV